MASTDPIIIIDSDADRSSDHGQLLQPSSPQPHVEEKQTMPPTTQQLLMQRSSDHSFPDADEDDELNLKLGSNKRTLPKSFTAPPKSAFARTGRLKLIQVDASQFQQQQQQKSSQQENQNSSSDPNSSNQHHPFDGSHKQKLVSKLLQPSTLTEKADSEVILSEEQQRVVELVVDKRQSVFFTGPAGVGKSLLLREIIKRMRIKFPYNPESVCVTASTGIAGCNIGGSTIHSFAGIGLGEGDREKLINRAFFVKKTRERWEKCNILIIDEISMIDGDMFDLLNEIAQRCRSCLDKPFGGIQVVLCGDFFQLPPVSKFEKGKPRQEKPFCFEAKSWPDVVANTIQLSKVFRQKDDEFIRILNELRLNQLSASSIMTLKSLQRTPVNDGGCEPTELYPLRAQVEHANNSKLKELDPATEHVFKFSDYVDSSRKDANLLRQRLAMHCNGAEELRLRVGAQVMLIFNADQEQGLVNGTLGLVQGFDEESGEPLVEFFPSNRATENGMLLKVPYHEWTIEDDKKKQVIASRSQIPLILAWAMSIHKSQGQTIQKLKVDLARSFEKGHVYVALSRATCLDQLQISNFDERKVRVHEKVLGMLCSFQSFTVHANGFINFILYMLSCVFCLL